jgi:hypothetical protein
MDSKHTIVDSKIASEPAMDFKQLFGDFKTDSGIIDDKCDNADELCTILFTNNKSGIYSKCMVIRCNLLKVQDPKDNIYDLHTIELNDFTRFIGRLYCNDINNNTLDNNFNKLYNYLMVDQKIVRTEQEFIKRLSRFIHNVLVDQKFTTDKKILDTYPVDPHGRNDSLASFGFSYTGVANYNGLYKPEPFDRSNIDFILKTPNDMFVYKTYTEIKQYNDPFPFGGIPREIVNNTYTIVLPKVDNVWECLCMPYKEYAHYRSVYNLGYFRDLNIQINENNLKYTITEICIAYDNFEVTINISE